MNRIHWVIFSTVLAVILPSPANAATEGALEINQDCIAVGCFADDTPGYPVTIQHPGSYILTSDLAPSGDPDTGTITVLLTTGPIDLDLNGHTISGGGTCTGTPVTSCSGALGSIGLDIEPTPSGVVHLHDGVVRGFRDRGIYASHFAEGSVIERMVVTETQLYEGITIDTNSASVTRIRDSQFGRNFGNGLNAFVGTRVYVENCTAVGNHLAGLYLQSGSIAVGNHLGSNASYGLRCNDAPGICALGQNTFNNNNGGGSAAQYAITALRDMGGNVCMDDGTCP